MLRLGLLLLAGVIACDGEGRWPGARGGGGDGPDPFPDGGPLPWVDADVTNPDGGVGEGSNILDNSGFERLSADESFAARWQAQADNPGGAIAIVGEPSYTGQRALEYDIGAAGTGYEFWVVQNNISSEQLVPGGRYLLSGFYRINDLGGGSINFNYILRPDSGDGDIGNDWDNTHPAEVDTWEPFEWEFVIPSEHRTAGYSLLLHLIKFTSIRVVLQVDEVSLLRVE